jgi:melibiose permease/lactose/raffinose/galactose permease
MIDEKQTKKNLWFYPLGTVGRDMMYYLFTNCILTYIMFTKQLTSAQLLAITGIMIAARIFDGLNDPIMGNIIERTRTRWGKFKPWLLIGVVLTSFVIYFAFNNSLEGWPFIISFGVIYFAYSITYTMNDISYWGMVPALSSDAELRNKFTSRAILFAGIGSTLATIAIPKLCHGENALGGSAGTAYGIVALVIAILAPAFLLFTLFGVRERRDDMDLSKPRMKFRDIFSTIKKNDQLRWMIVIFLVQQIGGSMVLAGVGQYFVYFRYGYEGGLFSIFSLVGVAATAILMIAYPALSRKFSRKKLMSFGMIMAVIGSILEVIGGLLMSGETPGFVVLTLGFMFVNLGLYGFYLIMMISIINTVEYNEYKTGQRNEAVIASMRPLLTKLGSAIVIGLTSLTYIIFRVTEKTNEIADFEQMGEIGKITTTERMNGINAVISTIEPGQTTGLLMAMVLVPLVFGFLSYVLYQKFYKLDEKKYDEIRAELEVRNALAAKKAAEEGK